MVTVVLFACFPQDRDGFTLAWLPGVRSAGFVGNRLQLFAAYGALLAGDLVNNPDQTFDIVLARLAETLAQ